MKKYECKLNEITEGSGGRDHLKESTFLPEKYTQMSSTPEYNRTKQCII